MFHVVLFQPEIPPNTGNIIRMCANTGAELHLVEPLGFDLDDKHLRRAGLDYHEYARLVRHPDWAACVAALAPRRMFAMTTRGSRNLFTVDLRPDDIFVFGQETAGLTAWRARWRSTCRSAALSRRSSTAASVPRRRSSN